MTTSEVDEPASPSPKVRVKSWLGKKRDLIERLSAGVNAASDSERGNLAQEMKKLAEKVESLEEENRSLAKKTKEIDELLAKKREEAQEVFEKSNETKKGLVGSLARKRGLLNEISFFEKEKSEIFKTYVRISERLQDNVSVLDRTLKDMGFFKGEIQALMEKACMLEGEVPAKYRDMDNLDEKIKRTFQTLRNFYGRMQRIEKTIKGTYYMSKKN